MNFFQRIISWFLAFLSMLGLFGSETKPEIKEGEFGFVLTYEVDGEIGTIDGTYVCKFEKVEYYLDGISRQWTGYIKGHEDSTRYALKTTDEGTIYVELDICSEFFMADPGYKANANTDDPKPEPYLYITSGDESVEDPANEILFNLYEGDDVKIISFEYDAPIENEYK